jgi:hypothetical protein
MESVRPSSLRGDIRLHLDKASPPGDRNGSEIVIPYLFVLRRRPVLLYLKVAAVSGSKIFLIIWMSAVRSVRF